MCELHDFVRYRGSVGWIEEICNDGSVWVVFSDDTTAKIPIDDLEIL